MSRDEGAIVRIASGRRELSMKYDIHHMIPLESEHVDANRAGS